MTNDRAWETYSTLQQRAEKLARSGQDKTETDLELEAYAARFSEQVSTVTGELEASLRDIIDYRIELEDEPAVLETVRAELESQAQTWRPRQPKVQKKPPRRPADGGDDEAMDDEDNAEEDDAEEDAQDGTPITGVNEVMQKVRQSKAEDWARMDKSQRYATHNDYILFKRTLHDAQHPNEEVSLPHASAWFGRDGEPVLSKVGEVAAPGEEDEDDELQITTANRDYRCPLSYEIIQEPYSNKKCSHSFEKKYIVEYIGNKGSVQCPTTGCSQVSHRCPLRSDISLHHLTIHSNLPYRTSSPTSCFYERSNDGSTRSRMQGTISTWSKERWRLTTTAPRSSPSPGSRSSLR